MIFIIYENKFLLVAAWQQKLCDSEYWSRYHPGGRVGPCAWSVGNRKWCQRRPDLWRPGSVAARRTSRAAGGRETFRVKEGREGGSGSGVSGPVSPAPPPPPAGTGTHRSCPGLLRFWFRTTRTGPGAAGPDRTADAASAGTTNYIII